MSVFCDLQAVANRVYQGVPTNSEEEEKEFNDDEDVVLIGGVPKTDDPAHASPMEDAASSPTPSAHNVSVRKVPINEFIVD